MNIVQSALVPCGLPLQAVSPLPAHRFLDRPSLYSPSGHPDVLLLQARFDLTLYSDALFSLYDLPAPDRLASAVSKRRAEYLASRVCVRYALCQLGTEGFILGNDADRAPVWPEGYVGSLSHTHQCISLLLASSASGKLLGVDCEQVMKSETAREMETMIVNPQEMAVLLESGLSFAAALTVAFSLKESLYKALFPQLRRFMNFDAAEITGCAEKATSVTLRLSQTFSGQFPAGREFTGRAALGENDIVSWVIAGN